MSLYLDSSALLKRYITEADSPTFRSILGADENWLTSRITWTEVARNLGRRLVGGGVTEARNAFTLDWQHIDVVEVDDLLARDAVRIADLTGVRTLDALHLAAMSRCGPTGLSLVTADLRQAQAARTLGWIVLGA